MELYLKQKVFSLKGRFSVYDADETPRYTVEGKYISLHNRHTIYDAAGKQVAAISKKPVSLLPKFFIELAGGQTYEMKGKFRLGYEECTIEELGWTIKGTFLQHDYTISDGSGEVLATVHQKWVSWGDTYEILINEGVDEVLVLAIIICFDVMHAESAAASSGSASAGG